MVRVCYGPGLSSPILLWSGFVKSDFVMVRDVMESDHHMVTDVRYIMKQ
jgi:hypothetical protein